MPWATCIAKAGAGHDWGRERLTTPRTFVTDVHVQPTTKVTFGQTAYRFGRQVQRLAIPRTPYDALPT